ncbi:MAG: hypothetical protein AAF266_08735 [Planctomycetota bacterium]
MLLVLSRGVARLLLPWGRNAPHMEGDANGRQRRVNLRSDAWLGSQID